jgi:hypothetical protein
MKTIKKTPSFLFMLFACASLVLASCAPQPATALASTSEPSAMTTAVPMLVPSVTPTPTASLVPSITPMPTVTPIPLPVISLSPGQFYFNLDGSPEIIYSRNVAAFFNVDYGFQLDWSQAGGTRVIRFGLVNNPVMGGYPYTNTGDLNEAVVRNIESLLDDAEAHGIYVLVWFTGWQEWNKTGQNDWAHNPFNAANGGPSKNPVEVFQEGTQANTMWFQYVSRLVARWQGRKNILAWEVLGEANLIQGITENQGISFVEHMAATIHAVDTQHRPITASLGDVGTWPNFYKTDAIDFVQIHPYPINNKLDRVVVDEVHQHLAAYGKPVLIGESGLNFEPMDNNWITSSPKAHIGIEHAVWVDVVSGAMNGRALYWEDAYAIYFTQTRSTFLNQYAEVELPVARFTSGVDFTGFKPVTVSYQSGTKIWGAAVGNDSMVLGWFRDAGSEPPNWNLLPNIHAQTVTLQVPGAAENWQVDFYDTKTGNALTGSALLTRQGDKVTVALPDFMDDIAFKLFVNPSGTIVFPPAPAPELAAINLTSTDPAAGRWVGSVFAETSDWAAVLQVDIQPGCKVGSACGKSAFSWCSIDLVLKEISGDTMVFDERKVSNTSTCAAGGSDHLRLQPDGTILYTFEPGTSGGIPYDGILYQP